MERFPENMTLETVFDKYCDTVYRLALARTKNEADAEDIVQTVFLKLCRDDTRFYSGEHIKAWLLKVTVNTSKNLLTSAWHRLTEPLDESLSGAQYRVSEVYDAVLKLPLKYRTVVHLFYYEDCSCAQIALMLKVSESAVKTRLRRAREMLGRELKGEYDV